MQTTLPYRRTIAAELTAEDRGAIAVIGVRGGQAAAVIAKCFQAAAKPTRTLFAPGALRYGVWKGVAEEDRNTPAVPVVGESLIVIAVDEEHFEVHCHGGRAAVRAILDDLRACGVAVVGWREWLEVACPRPDSAVTWEVVAKTKTVVTTAIALDQARGALRNWAADLLGTLAQHGAKLESGAAASGDACPSLLAVRHAAVKVLAREPLGRHLVQPWKVVIAGPPNVGKSSLINSLVGYQRAITYDQAGTTRDVVTASSAVHGWPVRWSDTAGIRMTLDPIEREGVERATEELRCADLVLGVFDVREGPETLQACLPKDLSVPVLNVANKVDLLERHRSRSGGGRLWICISAVTGEGIQELFDAIVGHWVQDEMLAGTPVPVTEYQRTVLRALSSAPTLSEATQILKEIAVPHSQEINPQSIIHLVP